MSQRFRLVLISSLVGAVVAGTAAWAFSQARQSQRELKAAQASLPANHLRFEPSPSDYVQIAVSLVTLVRQVANLFRPDKG